MRLTRGAAWESERWESESCGVMGLSGLRWRRNGFLGNRCTCTSKNAGPVVPRRGVHFLRVVLKPSNYVPFMPFNRLDGGMYLSLPCCCVFNLVKPVTRRPLHTCCCALTTRRLVLPSTSRHPPPLAERRSPMTSREVCFRSFGCTLACWRPRSRCTTPREERRSGRFRCAILSSDEGV